jgi:hypothetical protein
MRLFRRRFSGEGGTGLRNPGLFYIYDFYFEPPKKKITYVRVFFFFMNTRGKPGLNAQTLLMVLASSTSGDQHFCRTVKLCRPPPHQDWRRARTAGNRFARDDKEPGPQLSRHVRRKGAAPLSGAEEQTSRATSVYAQCACLISLLMGSVN